MDAIVHKKSRRRRGRRKLGRGKGVGNIGKTRFSWIAHNYMSLFQFDRHNLFYYKTGTDEKKGMKQRPLFHSYHCKEVV